MTTRRSFIATSTGTLAWWRAQSKEHRANPRGWPTAEEEKAAIERI